MLHSRVKTLEAEVETLRKWLPDGAEKKAKEIVDVANVLGGSGNIDRLRMAQEILGLRENALREKESQAAQYSQLAAMRAWGL